MNNVNLKNKTIFITGIAGSIGSNLAKKLFETVEGAKAVGIDNMNDYYDVSLKEYRLKELEQNTAFTFVKDSIADKASVTEIFQKYQPQIIVNLAAQAGVRYSDLCLRRAIQW